MGKPADCFETASFLSNFQDNVIYPQKARKKESPWRLWLPPSYREIHHKSLYGDQMYLAVHLKNCAPVPSGLWLSYGNAVVQSHTFPEMSHIQWWLNSSLDSHCPDWLERGQPLVQISSRHRWINLPADSARVACMTVSCLTLWGPHSLSPSHCWSLTTVLLLVLIWCCLPGEPQISHPMKSKRKY